MHSVGYGVLVLCTYVIFHLYLCTLQKIPTNWWELPQPIQTTYQFYMLIVTLWNTFQFIALWHQYQNTSFLVLNITLSDAQSMVLELFAMIKCLHLFECIFWMNNQPNEWKKRVTQASVRYHVIVSAGMLILTHSGINHYGAALIPCLCNSTIHCLYWMAQITSKNFVKKIHGLSVAMGYPILIGFGIAMCIFEHQVPSHAKYVSVFLVVYQAWLMRKSLNTVTF